ncbi:DUF1380 family protein [Kosakonia sp. SOY2]|uniref:DUF1380 family protein n=1 Tax=Kosakonia sp. SOY2 TaxID=3014557 RepID=UPI0022AC1438|nr:DUF1380 family protein [Kosakonia sp. SOY2]MCZ3384892.1 DUF1380 family protein [Kosakonia sp. SOY2]
MLYGTRKELNKKLKRAFGDTEKFALLVWSRETIIGVAEDMTELEADRILEEIGGAGSGDHAEEGISFGTVLELLAGLRAAPAMVSVPAALLELVSGWAERCLNEQDALAWKAGGDTPETVTRGHAALTALKQFTKA